MFTLYALLVVIALVVGLGFHHVEKVLIRIEQELKWINTTLAVAQQRDESKILIDKDVLMAVPPSIIAAAALRVGLERAEAAAKAGAAAKAEELEKIEAEAKAHLDQLPKKR
jgi:hypothetical protein